MQAIRWAMAGQGIRRRAVLVAVALVLGGVVTARALLSDALPVVPVPSPVIKVHTESGSVVKDTIIPLGGVPVPVDVDNRSLLGLLSPDVDVSVGMLALDELPGSPLVPTIQINRNALAIARNTPAPPLKISLAIDILNASAALTKYATIKYGYTTPPGGLAPSRFKSKLVGPLTSGFIDPLEAIVETPGYSAPLTINANVDTAAFKGDFNVGLDPIPERLHFIEDPRDDGLDFSYDHEGPIPDVKLRGVATLTDPDNGDKRVIDTTVERLPADIRLSSTSSGAETSYEYEASSLVGKPDVEASYRHTKANGTVVSDAGVRIAGLPFHMRGEVRYDADGEIDGARVDVLDGEAIDAVDFETRNYVGDPGALPEHQLAPDPFVSAVSRRIGGDVRKRVAGRLTQLRHVAFDRLGDDGLDLVTDMGSGADSLRAIFDLDDRGTGAPAGAKRTMVDTTLTPLPRQTHTRFEPATPATPSRVLYEASSTMDVDTVGVVAKGAGQECGEASVTCLEAAVDRLPSSLSLELPPDQGSDFLVRHSGSGTSKPDLRATVDATDEDADRKWSSFELLGLPTVMRGRLDHSAKGVLRAAEFHACDFDFAAGDGGACRDDQQAIGRVTFTVRDRPERTGLPPRPDTVQEAVTLAKRCRTEPVPPATCPSEAFEIHGRVSEVRNVAFRQRDLNDDGTADGTLGVLVDAGTGTRPFDARIDQVDDALGEPAEEDDPKPRIGDDVKRVEVDVRPLPALFRACVRAQADTPVQDDLPGDALLGACDGDGVLEPPLSSTPLSVDYLAQDADGKSQPTEVRARVFASKPDEGDKDASGNPRVAVTSLNADVTKVPGNLHADVIPPVKPAPGVPGRKLQFAYDVDDDGDSQTSEKIDTIDFSLESRRQGSLCEDPRANRKALCVHAVLHDLTEHVDGSFDPDETKGDLLLNMERADASDARPSVDPLRLSVVSPDPADAPLVLDGRLLGLSDHLKGKIQKLNLDAEDPDHATGTLQQKIATCSDGGDDDNDGKVDAADPDCATDLAQAGFDACPEGACDGIERIAFTATNALVADPLPEVTPEGGEEFSFVQRGDVFRAGGDIHNLKKVAYTRLREDSSPSPASTMSAAFGTGDPNDKIHAVVDRQASGERQLVDALISQAPKQIDVCFRKPTEKADLQTDGESYCEREDADGNGASDERSTAVQAKLVQPGSVQPRIDVRRFELGKASGTDVLRGPPGTERAGDPSSCTNGVDDDVDAHSDGEDSDCGSALTVDDLASEINVLSTDDDPATTQVDEKALQVEGPRDGDGDVGQAAGRVTFSLRSFEGPFMTGADFPYGSLDHAIDDPRYDADNDDPAGVPNKGRNYLLIAQDVDRQLLEGSVPAISRVAMRSAACDPADPRYPSGLGFEMKCVEAKAAGGRPLGLAVRTRDEKGDVVDIERGHLTQVPSGGDGLSATIAKAPDSLKEAPTCPNASAPTVCQPPLLSVEAPRGVGQSADDVQLRARMFLGHQDAVGALRFVTPQDTLSDNLVYEQDPEEYAANGVRIKVSKGPLGKAVRMGLRVKVPQFLDLDPLVNVSCARVALGPCQKEGENAAGVGEDENAGVNTKDILLKLVASDAGHGGTPVPTLGRVALLVDDPTAKGGQTIITGAPDPQNSVITELFKLPESFGGTSWTLNDVPPEGAHDLGFEAPGHLEAGVYLRTDYADSGHQTQFAQVDGRVNRPLSLTVRLQESEAPGRSRDRRQVPKTQLTIRNAPGLGHNAPDFTDPTFRVRAELRKPAHTPESDDPNCQGFDDVSELDLGILAVGGCVTLPAPETAFVDVAMNMRPYADRNPARTVEAVVDRTSRKDVEARGYDDTYPAGTPIASRTPASFTPQANLLLAPFELGAKGTIEVLGGFVGAGLGLTIGGADSSLMVRSIGKAVDRLALSNDAGKIELAADGGSGAALHTDWLARLIIAVKVKLFWGVVDKSFKIPLPQIPFPIDHRNCSFGGLIPNPSSDLISVGAGESRTSGATLGVGPAGSIPAIVALAAKSGTAAAIVEGLLSLPSGIQCFALDTSTSPILKDTAPNPHPSPVPSYNDPQRPVPDSPEAPAFVSGPPPTPNPTPVLPDLSVGAGETQTYCGTIVVDRLDVVGTLQAGTQGTTNTQTIGGVTETVECNGGLNISANEVMVDGGLITASGTRTSGGAGQPTSGFGGGASHRGAGGNSGSGGAGSTVIYRDHRAGGGFGSVGRQGTGTVGGGAGGGLIDIRAGDFINITDSGQIAADGARGGDTGDPACSTTGGGGGSGGTVYLSANLIEINDSARVSVRGGHGGTGGHGGGGGGGGHATLEGIAVDDAVTVVGGNPGPAAANCTSGGGGGGGAIDNNDMVRRSQIVRLDEAALPFEGKKFKLQLQGLQDGGDTMTIVYCRRGEFAGGFEDDRLHPVGTSVAELVDPANAACSAKIFGDGRNTDITGDGHDDSYRANVDIEVTEDGFYGFYSMAAKPFAVSIPGGGTLPASQNPCLGTVINIKLHERCEFQPALPDQSTALLGVDETPPEIGGAIEEGDCPNSSVCLQRRTAPVDFPAIDRVSGIDHRKTKCSVFYVEEGFGEERSCPSDDQDFQISGGDGERLVGFSVTDLRNYGTSDYVARFFVDVVAPNKPLMQLTADPTDPGTNGWLQRKPTLVVGAGDPSAKPAAASSSGLAGTRPIHLVINGTDRTCGHITTQRNQALCDATESSPLLPGQDGIYTLEAHVSDVAGNRSEPFTKSDRKSYKLDGNAPESHRFLHPGTPDGAGGFYTSAPFFGFAAFDGDGGSGVDPGVDPSGIFYAVDGGPSGTWQPSDFTRFDADADLRLPEGRHDICWYAVDVADNREAGGDPFGTARSTNCTEGVRTDATPPVVSLRVTPDNPDGTGGWYVNKPLVTITGVDPVPEGVPASEISGLDRVEYQIDEGPWTAAAPVRVDEGTHEIRARAFDKAGNRSDVRQVTVRVDLSRPSVRIGSFPTAPNVHGFFRRPRVHTAAAGDARDGSGVASISHRIDGGAPALYVRPLSVGHGQRTVSASAVDRAGLESPSVAQSSTIDQLPPVPKTAEPGPGTIALGGSTTMRFTVDPTFSTRVKVSIIVYGPFGMPAHRIAVPGTTPDGYRPAGAGSVTWNGRQADGTPVVSGLYHYRVEAVDEAGNTAISSESATFAVLLLGLPL